MATAASAIRAARPWASPRRSAAPSRRGSRPSGTKPGPRSGLDEARRLGESGVEGAAEVIEAAQRQVALARAYAAYQRLLATAGCIDFGDQVGLAVRLLEDHPTVRQALRQRYRFVLVDEFQDTDPAQLRLLQALVGPRGNLTVVGDDDQAIYAFRGAVDGAAHAALRAWPTATTITLRCNYRSRRPILAAAARLIACNDPTDPPQAPRRPLGAHRRARPRPVLCEGFGTVEAEAAWVADTLAARARAGLPLREMAVLVRSNRDVLPFLQALDVVGLATPILRRQRPARAAGGPRAAGLPAHGRRPRFDARPVRPRHGGALSPRRIGPHHVAGDGPPASSAALGGPA